MSLKPGRSTNDTEISYFAYSTMTRGGVVCAVASGSLPSGTFAGFGEGMDSGGQRCEYATSASGKVPLGVLLHDVVNIDQSRQFLNPYKSEVQVGDKVTILQKGYVVTSNIATATLAGITIPTPAYVGLGGSLYAGIGYNTGSGYPRVGYFQTYLDTDGYAKVRIDC